MATTIANVETTNTFDYWRQRTNELAHAMSTEVLTVGGASLSGNVEIDGSFISDNITVNTDINIGTAAANAYISTSSIYITNSTSNTTITLDEINIGNISSNSKITDTDITVGNSTVNTFINNNSLVTGNTTVNSISIYTTTLTVGNSTVNTSVNNSIISVGNSTINVAINSTSIAISNTSNTADLLVSISTNETDISNLQSNVGSVASLTTSNTTSLVGAVNEIDSDVGNTSTLTTSNTTSLVGAVNEIDSDVGNTSTLTTSNTTNLVGALNSIITERTAFPSNLVPDADGTRNLGADATRFNAVYGDFGRFTNNMLTGVGSVSSPSISFEGDTNTGFYRTASGDAISASTGGAENFRFQGNRAAINSGSLAGTPPIGTLGPATYKSIANVSFVAKSTSAMCVGTCYLEGPTANLYVTIRMSETTGTGAFSLYNSLAYITTGGDVATLVNILVLNSLNVGTTYNVDVQGITSPTGYCDAYAQVAVFT